MGMSFCTVLRFLCHDIANQSLLAGDGGQAGYHSIPPPQRNKNRAQNSEPPQKIIATWGFPQSVPKIPTLTSKKPKIGKIAIACIVFVH